MVIDLKLQGGKLSREVSIFKILVFPEHKLSHSASPSHLMKIIANSRLWSALACLAFAVTFSSCASNSTRTHYSSAPSQRTVDRSHNQKGLLAAIFGSDRDRRARESAAKKAAAAAAAAQRPVIPATRVNHGVYSRANKSNTRVQIDISRQKVYLLVDGQIAVTAPISSARPGKHTPRGTFSITEKVETGKISTIYDVHMPNWMRLNGSEYGIHAGYLPGYPASAGCVRMPRDAAAMIYAKVGYGTQVTISDSWSPNPIGSSYAYQPRY